MYLYAVLKESIITKQSYALVLTFKNEETKVTNIVNDEYRYYNENVIY